MKKKKLLLTIAALSCATAFAFAVAACSNNDSGDNGGDNGVGNGVTAEEWSSALNAATASANWTVTTQVKMPEETEGISTIMKVDNANSKYEINSSDYTSVYAKDGDKYYSYYSDDSAQSWGKTELSAEEFTVITQSFSEGLVLISSVKDAYASFTYDVTENRYVAENIAYEISEVTATAAKVIAKIEGGQAD